MEMKETIKYTFSVEGQTEKWYLDWLADRINENPQRAFNVKIKAKVEQSPLSFMKSINNKTTTEVIHLCDIESEDEEHVNKFEDVISQIKEAQNMKKIQYSLGYSNFTFELWLILHKKCFDKHLDNRGLYLKYINEIFSESFLSLNQFKEEKNFKRCLSKLSLKDVINAIKNSDNIMNNKDIDLFNKKMTFKGVTYYRQNPSLNIHSYVKNIIDDSGCR